MRYRKLRDEKSIDQIDTESRSREYWNRILKSLNLDMTRGLDTNIVEYAGTSQNLERRGKGPKSRTKRRS
jgi:hypothetical protein